MARISLLTLVLGLTLAVHPTAAQVGVLDLVPEDASLALGIRDIAALRDKGDGFARDHRLNLGDVRPSRWFSNLFEKHLLITQGLDDRGAAAIVLPNTRKLGFNQIVLEMLYHLVFVIPVADRDAMGGNFGLKAGDLKPDTYLQDRNGRALYLRGKHLLISDRKKALEVFLDAKPVTAELSPAQKASLTRADIAIHFGARAWGLILENLIKDAQRNLGQADNPAEAEVFKQLFAALQDVRFVIAGLRVQPGLDLDIIASFDKKEGGVPFLDALRGGPGAADLLGLPDADPVAAYAARGDGVRNVTIARALLRRALGEVPGLSAVLAAADRQKLLAAFDPMYQRLKGSRAALYPGTDRDRTGWLAGVAVLDLDDPAAHLGHWTEVTEVLTTAAARAYPAGQAPKFVYKPRAEMLDGVRVDWLLMEGAGENADMRRVLGPDWNRVRLAVLDRGAVLLVGSDLERLRQTIRNRQTGARGLVDNAVVRTALAELAPERKLEVHLNLANFMGRPVKPGDPDGPLPVRGLTSFALTIEPDRLQLQIRAPASECTALIQFLGMAQP